MLKKLKRFVIGEALPNWEYKHQRLSKKLALPVFSSDALSSVAYATEEILLVLMTAGALFLGYSLPISLTIMVLLWILIVSYRQTIMAYPKGGGAYIVSKDNLGVTPGLVAASALLMDYVLTAAVSVAAGVAALTSAFPELFPYKIMIGVFVLGLITLINLKGVKESGIVFSIPTYLFIITFMAMLGIGFFRFFTGQIPEIDHTQVVFTTGVSTFLLLRAFSSGCAALTGIEAISDGVPAFKKPEARNARATLTIMAVILSVLFFGITFLSYHYGVIPMHDRTVVSMLAENIFGRSFFFFVIQAFTMLILFLAANTSYADFPRLCFFLAKDRFMPNQFKQLGDRLVFSTGIVFLGICSSLLLIFFQGNVHSLIPLYAVGVFTSFTLSQAGMVRRNIRLKEKRWKRKAFVNAFGAMTTFVALIIIAVTKFLSGAWMIVLLIPTIILILKKINKHYTDISEELSVEKLKAPLKKDNEKHMMVVLVPSFHKGIIKAIQFAKTFCSKSVAIHIDISGTDRDKIKEKWNLFKPGIPLIIIDSPYRKLLKPLMHYLDELEKKDPTLNVTVVIPEFVPTRWWHYLLHNQTAISVKAAIHFRKRTSYISVQYHLSK